MHWTAGFRVCYMSDVIGPPPVMSIVKHHHSMKRLKRVLAGIFSLGLGVSAIWLAVAAYRAGRDLAPLLKYFVTAIGQHSRW